MKHLKPLFYLLLFLLNNIAIAQNPISHQTKVKVVSRPSISKSELNKTDHSETEWYKAMKVKNPNYFKVRKLYNQYFESHPKDKSVQRSEGRRWLDVNYGLTDKKGNIDKAIPTIEDYNKIKRAENKAKRVFSGQVKSGSRFASPPPNATWNDSVGTWRMTGPYHPSTRSGVLNMYGGFCDRVYINPYDTTNWISGQSYGGIWVSHDSGDTWALTDSEFPNGSNTSSNRDLYYGEIEAHPLDHNRIVAGTEAGVLISDNGGDDWTLASQMNYMDSPGKANYFIALKPDDTQVILASQHEKIYRTADGGQTWNVVFDNTGKPWGSYGKWWKSIVGISFHPTQPDTVILAALNANSETILYKSTDGGLTFSEIANNGIAKKTKLVTSLDDPDHIYLTTIFIDLNNVNADEGIYKYDMNGTLIQFTKYDNIPTQMALLDEIAVDQKDKDKWYIAGYASSGISKSTDGGNTWVRLNPGGFYNGPIDYVHADIRAMYVIGDNVLVGTDGGLHRSFDEGELFVPGGEWISAIDLWGYASGYKGEVIASGDDHGPTEVRILDADKSWHGIGGADSGELTINECNTDYIYGSSLYGRFLGVRVNDTTYHRYGKQLVESKYKYLAMDPDEYFKLYPIQGPNLLVSDNNMKSATINSTFNSDIIRVKVALQNNQLWYVITEANKVWKTEDAGASWTDKTPPNSVSNGRTLTDITINEAGDQLWLAYGNWQSTNKIAQSTDNGDSWTNITGPNLPNHVAKHISYQRGTDGMVYLGLKGGGVWYKSNQDADWSILGSGLPRMGYITSIYTVPDMNKFRMGTSRGSFEHELAIQSDVLAHFAVQSKKSTNCQYDTSYFYDYSSYYDNESITFNWTFEGGTPATSTEMNPKVIYENLGVYDVSLTISDGTTTSTVVKEDFMLIENGECEVSTSPGMAMNISKSSYLLAPGMNIANTESYTMMGWFKGEGVQKDYAGLLSVKTSNGNVHLNARNINPDSTKIGLHHPNGSASWNSGFYLVPNQWTHLALVVSPNHLTIYKNGNPKIFNANVQPCDLFDKFVAGAMIGAEGYRYFTGMVDEVSFYDRSLTTDEIRKMMHLTKQNPNYPAQHDDGLIAYYQFNESSGGVVYDVSGNGKNGVLFGNNASRLVSDGPFGGGTSDIEEITSTGITSFSTTGVDIGFTSPLPNGSFVVSHIENLPDTFPTAKKMHEKGYYILNNYGPNQTVGPLSSLTFNKTGTISNHVAVTGANFEFLKRPSNMHDQLFSTIINSNFSLTAGNYGVVKANDASPITSFSQFIITRDAYPMDDPKVRMVTPDKATEMVEGGESISLYMDSDNQGLLLPVLTNADFNSLGTPVDGMMAYAQELKSLVIFSQGTWNEINTIIDLQIVEGSVVGTTGISMGNAVYNPSAIVELKNKGFIKYSTMTDSDLPNIKYPIEAMLIYNGDSQKLQVFNGSNWKDVSTQSSTITVANGSPMKVEGYAVGMSKVDNAVLEDADPNAVMMIPSLSPEMIKNPQEGMFLFDDQRNKFYVYDGVYWKFME